MNWQDKQYVDTELLKIFSLLTTIKQQGDKIMAQIDDLNVAIATLTNTANQLGTDIQASIADLQAKLAAALAAGTPPDLSGPIAAIQAAATSLANLDTSTKGL